MIERWKNTRDPSHQLTLFTWLGSLKKVKATMVVNKLSRCSKALSQQVFSSHFLL